MRFYDTYFKLKDMELAKVNDIEGNWKLEPIEDIGITARQEPQDSEPESEELTNPSWGNFARHMNELPHQALPQMKEIKPGEPGYAPTGRIGYFH